MKRFISSALLVLCALQVFSQSTVLIDVKGIKIEDGSLYADYSIRLTPEAVNTRQGQTIYPMLQAGDSALVLPGVIILGSNKNKILSRTGWDREHAFIRADIKQDTVLNFRQAMPCQKWMDGASLVFVQELHDPRNRVSLTVYRINGLNNPLRQGNSEEYDRVKVEYDKIKVEYDRIKDEIDKIKDGYGKTVDGDSGQIRNGANKSTGSGNRYKVQEDVLYFNQGSAVIWQNRDWQHVSALLQDPKVKVLGIQIKGYASIEGTYYANERLSRERADAMKAYLKRKFNLLEPVFTVSSAGEDWDGLAACVQASDMPQKERILEIISTIGILNGREAALMRLDGGVPYRDMKTNLFPRLRRVEYTIEYEVTD